jgi:DNA polymerase kappa
LETWPYELLFEVAERQEREDDLQELETLSQEIDKRRHHGKEIVPNPKKDKSPEEEWWDCPICMRPQATSEKEFNEHIDLCLSRGMIRDAVQETAVPISRDHTPAPPAKKARGRDKGSLTGDPKQRKLFFG